MQIQRAKQMRRAKVISTKDIYHQYFSMHVSRALTCTAVGTCLFSHSLCICLYYICICIYMCVYSQLYLNIQRMYELIYMGPYKLKYCSPNIFGNFSFSMIIYIYHFEGILRTFSTKPSMGREGRTGTSISLLNIRTSLKKEISRIISLSPKQKERHHQYNIPGYVTFS